MEGEADYSLLLIAVPDRSAHRISVRLENAGGDYPTAQLLASGTLPWCSGHVRQEA
jgi:hypothetical protein